MNCFELTARYDRCKSFYRKAFVYEDENEIILRSYDSDVVFVHKNLGSIAFGFEADYSRTTLRHVNEFMRYLEDNYKYRPREVLERLRKEKKLRSINKVISYLALKGSEVFVN